MDDIINAAREEKWEYVDERIPQVCDNLEIQERALILLKDSNGNIRDLGASIFGKAQNISKVQFSRAIPALKTMMNNDSNPYARYRAAFALAEHAPDKYRDDIVRVLKEAAKDKDVGKIAKNYLARLK